LSDAGIHRCKPGSEQVLALSIMNKYKYMAAAGKKLEILSAIASSVKGYLYVESHNEPAVR
jgi:Early transcription elongation factor of RNA pol II, NGN section